MVPVLPERGRSSPRRRPGVYLERTRACLETVWLISGGHERDLCRGWARRSHWGDGSRQGLECTCSGSRPWQDGVGKSLPQSVCLRKTLCHGGILASLTGKSDEQRAAAALASVLCIQLGPGIESEEVLKTLGPILKKIICDGTASIQARQTVSVRRRTYWAARPWHPGCHTPVTLGTEAPGVLGTTWGSFSDNIWRRGTWRIMTSHRFQVLFLCDWFVSAVSANRWLRFMLSADCLYINMIFRAVCLGRLSASVISSCVHSFSLLPWWQAPQPVCSTRWHQCTLREWGSSLSGKSEDSYLDFMRFCSCLLIFWKLKFFRNFHSGVHIQTNDCKWF